jgi:hypothetical protein
MGIRLLLASLCIGLMIGKATSDELRVLAAGSLREVLGEIGKHYEQATGTPVVADFGLPVCCESVSRRVSMPTCLPRRIWAIR